MRWHFVPLDPIAVFVFVTWIDTQLISGCLDQFCKPSIKQMQWILKRLSLAQHG